MLSSMPKVSVIMPVYNVEAYVADAVQSVLQQTYTNFELLIIDDESPDRSIEICQQFHDGRIQIIRQRNRGLAGARNTGIRYATGELLAFIDSDDMWLPQKLERHVAHLQQNPQIGVSFCRSAFIDDTGKPTSYYQMPKLTGITSPLLLCRNPVGNGSAPVIRREVMDAIRFEMNLYGSVEDFYFDDRLRRSEDIECWIRISILTDWQLEGIPEALTLYRVNAGGLSADIPKQLESWEAVITKTRTYAPELVDRWAPAARAYQLRYLARRAVFLQDGGMAVEFVHRALKTHWQILFTEPRRTLMTIAAAYLLCLLPRHLYHQLEAWMLHLTGATQKRRILKEVSTQDTTLPETIAENPGF